MAKKKITSPASDSPAVAEVLPETDTPTETAASSSKKTKPPADDSPKLSVKDNALLETLEVVKQLAVDAHDDSLTERVDEFVDSFTKLLQWKKKITRQQRRDKKAANGDEKAHAPTAYNQFVKEHMARLREEDPTLTPKERMSRCSQMWNATKTSAAETAEAQ